MLIKSVFFLFLFLLLSLDLALSVILCCFVFGIIILCVNIQTVPMYADGKEIFFPFLFATPRLNDIESYSLPGGDPPLTFVTSLCLCLLLRLPFLLFHQNFSKWELCGLLCAGGKGALD